MESTENGNLDQHENTTAPTLLEPSSSSMEAPVTTATTTTTSVTTNASLHLGQRFLTRQEAKFAIQDHCQRHKKRAMLDNKRSGGSNFTYRCKSATPCGFFVTIVRSRSAKRRDFFISSMQLEHDSTCSSIEKATLRQAADCHEVRKAILANPQITAAKLQTILKDSSDGVEIPVRMCHRLRENLLKELDERYAKSFTVLKGLLQTFQQLNPTSFVDFQANEAKEFRRAFLLAPYARALLSFGPKIMGLDHLEYKCKGYKGNILVLLTMDGNNECVYLAVALCPSNPIISQPQQDGDNYQWFLRCCQQAGLFTSTNAVLPLVCDPRLDWSGALPMNNSSGMMLSMPNEDPPSPLPIVVVYCVRHLIDDMISKFGSYFAPEQQAFVWRAQDAETKEQFEFNLQRLRLAFPQAAMYLDAIPREKWAKYTFSQRRLPLYGWKTTNFQHPTDKTPTEKDEAFIAMMDMTPLDVFKHWMEKMMKFLFAKKEEVVAWRERGLSITPFAQNMFASEAAHMCHHDVLPSDPMHGVAFVSDSRSLDGLLKRRVCMRETSCSCSFMDQYGIPCRHFQAALNFFNANSYNVAAAANSNTTSGNANETNNGSGLALNLNSTNRCKPTGTNGATWNLLDAFHRHYCVDAIHTMLLALAPVEFPLNEHLLSLTAMDDPASNASMMMMMASRPLSGTVTMADMMQQQPALSGPMAAFAPAPTQAIAPAILSHDPHTMSPMTMMAEMTAVVALSADAPNPPNNAKKRKAEDNAEESTSSADAVRKCGRCHEYGHNRRTCTKTSTI